MNYIEDFQVITTNAAVCHLCVEYIESKYGHDFKWCSCQNVAVDGGKNYIRRAFKDKGTYTEMNEYRNMTIEELKAKIGRLEEYAKSYNSSSFRDQAEFGKELMEVWYGTAYID